MGLLIDTVVELMEWWDDQGLHQQGKYTTKQLREAHLSHPWNTFSIATYDGMNAGCHDFPLILPSNQCQESWHKGIMKLLKGQLRGSTDHVLKVSLKRILLDDTINMPRELCFEPINVNVRHSRPHTLTPSRPHTVTPSHPHALLWKANDHSQSSSLDGRAEHNDQMCGRYVLRPSL